MMPNGDEAGGERRILPSVSLDRRYETVIIGGGQAGLAMSRVLQDIGREHVILERARVAERWRSERWDTLRFQFPNWTIGLPGYRHSGNDPDGFAGADDIAQLLGRFAASSRAPVIEGCEVTALERDPSTTDFVMATSSGEVRAANVVVATGPFQRPAIPPLSNHLPAHILQLDPTRYRRPEGLPPGAVLVVGSGASGAQIADDLLRSGRTVYLSVSSHRRVPRRFRGKDMFWWLEKLGRFNLTLDDLPGGRRPPGLLVTGVDGGYDLTMYGLAADGAVLAGHLTGATDGRVSFADDVAETLHKADQAYLDFVAAARAVASDFEAELALDEGPRPTVEKPMDGVRSLDLEAQAVGTVIWATGYEYAYDWLHLPLLDERGSPIQRRGVTSESGLFFIGLHWMHTLRSGLLMGVGDDARYLGEQMEGVRG
jgi:putative flavoprotein involved in K+ transport